MSGIKTNTLDMGRSLQKLLITQELHRSCDYSILGRAIRIMLDDPLMFDDLIETVLSRGQDNPDLMRKVIGKKAYCMIKLFKQTH